MAFDDDGYFESRVLAMKEWKQYNQLAYDAARFFRYEIDSHEKGLC